MTEVRQGMERFGGELTARERWNRVMHYQRVDYVSHMEFGYWDELKADWMAQGYLPEHFRMPGGHIPDNLVEEYFGCEQWDGCGPRIGTMPVRERKIIEQSAELVVYRDELGVLKQERIEGTRTIPHFLEFPIRDRATWQAFRDEFLNLDHPVRQVSEQDLQAAQQMSRASTLPVELYFGSFIGWIRDWVGFQNLAYMSMDDPDLLEEMVEHVASMLLKLMPVWLERVQYDAAGGWEDICFNSGPILSPTFFKERIMPHMRPCMQMMRQHGIDVIWTDCDGSILKLIPLWMNIGLNCMFPLEVRPGNDPVALKKEYGRDLLIRGGFDKDVLYEGRKAIVAELKRLEPAVADGGFVPHIDHRCPGEVPFDTYRYYTWEKCHMLGWPEDKIKSFPALQGWKP